MGAPQRAAAQPGYSTVQTSTPWLSGAINTTLKHACKATTGDFYQAQASAFMPLLSKATPEQL